MKPPSRIAASYYELEVEVSDVLDSERNEFGDFRYPKIRLATGLTPIEEANTLLHELFHAALEGSSVLPAEDREVVEEHVCEHLANFLTEVLARNPELVRYLASAVRRSSA
jgi:hypothetical protein